jgi:hypothetical protein
MTNEGPQLAKLIVQKMDGSVSSVPEANSMKDALNGVFKDTIKLEIPKRVPLSTPYYLKEEREGNVYAMTNQNLIGFPEAKSPLTILFILFITSFENISKLGSFTFKSSNSSKMKNK